LLIFTLFLFVLLAMMGEIAIDVLKNQSNRTQALDRGRLMAAGLTVCRFSRMAAIWWRLR